MVSQLVHENIFPEEVKPVHTKSNGSILNVISVVIMIASEEQVNYEAKPYNPNHKHKLQTLLKYYEGVYESLALTHKNKMDLFLFCLELSLFTVFL